MRLPKDANKIKGYGYVEFEDRQSLIDALSMTNTVSKRYLTIFIDKTKIETAKNIIFPYRRLRRDE